MECLKIVNNAEHGVFDHWEIKVHHELEDVEVPVWDRVFHTINKEGQVIRQEIQVGYIKVKRCKHCPHIELLAKEAKDEY